MSVKGKTVVTTVTIVEVRSKLDPTRLRRAYYDDIVGVWRFTDSPPAYLDPDDFDELYETEAEAGARMLSNTG